MVRDLSNLHIDELDDFYNNLSEVQKMIFNMNGGSGASSADKVKYDNTESQLQAIDVQNAIDEMSKNLRQLELVLLWNNPDPTSNFTAQNITLNSKDYSYYEIYSLYDVQSSYLYSTYSKGIKGKGQIISLNDSSGNRIQRSVRFIDDTNLYISTAKLNGTDKNNYLVPLCIYGVK